MVLEILGNGIISLMDTNLLYLFVGLFLHKRNFNWSLRLLPFVFLLLLHIISPSFINASLLRTILFFTFDILFCIIQFQDKWYKYTVYIGLYYILYLIIESSSAAVLNSLTDFDVKLAFANYELLLFIIIFIVRIIMLLVILLIKSMLNRSIQQKQWLFFLLMPILTIIFLWLIYPNYWRMGNPEIDRLLTYVGAFLVIQNVFVFFYVISLQSSTKQYIEIKEAFDRREEYVRTIKAIQKAVRKMAHDIRHHFIYLRSALDQEDIPKAKAYLTQLDENLENMIPLNVTGHYDVDALLHAKARLADGLGVHIRVDGVLPPKIMISPIDISVLLGNSLDNAITATSQVNDQKEISISFVYNAPRLSFTISNPYVGKLQKKQNGYFISQKYNGGLGVEIMDQVVKKYNGALLTDYNDNQFTLSAMLQAQCDDKKFNQLSMNDR